MEITEVRIKLVAAKNDKLRAFCSITIDNAFVVRDLKVIEGSKGPFVAMPSRKVMQRCRKCGEKNHHRANFCNDCGGRLPAAGRSPRADLDGTKLHADIAHPINSECREMVQRRVLDSYGEELERSKEPGYQPQGEDFEGDDFALESEPTGGRLGDYAEPAADNFGRSPDWVDTDGRRGAPPNPARREPARRAAPAPGSARADEGGAPRPAHEAYRSTRSAFPAPEAPAGSPAEQPARPAASLQDDVPSEPEDNFGAGLFS